MARRRTPPASPKRRTYRTGANLPALTTDWRPIPLGRDENGEPDGSVRALAVLLRNRSDSSVYIREGPDSDDAFEIAKGEDYRIWESNGINTVSLKGDEGGETVEVRTLEAHNDFDLTDKIDAFARSIAHFIQTATSNTTISGQDIDLTIDDADGISIAGTVDIDDFGDTVTVDDITASSATFDVAGSVDIDEFADTVTIDDITAGTVDIDEFADTVTVDDIQAANATFDVAGSVDVDNVADEITIEDITAASASFDGDITGQSDFELSVRDIEGTPVTRFLREKNVNPGETDTNLGEYIPEYEEWTLFEDADTDGFVTGWEVRIYNDSDISTPDIGARLEIDDGDGDGYEDVMPRAFRSAAAIQELAEDSAEATVAVADANRNCTYRIEPRIPYKFREGDSVRFYVGPDTAFGNPESDYNIELSVTYIERRET